MSMQKFIIIFHDGFHFCCSRNLWEALFWYRKTVWIKKKLDVIRSNQTYPKQSKQ